MIILLTILELESSPDLLWGIMFSGTVINLLWIWELSGTGMFEVIFGCNKLWGCYEIGFYFNCIMGLSSGVDTGNLIFHFVPALPWPNLGLIWYTPFASEAIMGFIACFSGLLSGSNPFPTPCTSGKLMLLDLACDLV